MAEHAISSRYGSLFGMDAHARSATVRGLDLATGETETKRFGDCPGPAEIAERTAGGFAGPLYAAYESGCTGFHLCRELRGLGVDCDVVAISAIARSVDERKHKNDRRDAKLLLAEMPSPGPSFSAVWAPDAECEGERDLARARHDAGRAPKRSRRQAGAILVRHGRVWSEKEPSGRVKTTWGRDHVRWTESQSLPGASQEALQYYPGAIAEQQTPARKLDALVKEHVELPRWKPAVDALSHVKGIDVPSALLLAVEFGDFSRLGSGRAVSCRPTERDHLREGAAQAAERARDGKTCAPAARHTREKNARGDAPQPNQLKCGPLSCGSRGSENAERARDAHWAAPDAAGERVGRPSDGTGARPVIAT